MKHHLATLAVVILLLINVGFISTAANKQNSNVFNNALIRMDGQGQSPTDIRFENSSGIPLATFFEHYHKAFNLSPENEARPFRVFTDKLGQSHHRCKQYYRGIELAEVQYLLHEKDGLVFHAHGKLIHGLNLSVKPTLSEAQALQFALRHINAQTYMWENAKNEALLKKEQNDPEATYFPTGKLMLSAGHQKMTAENFRLVYRFDIFAIRPLSRNYVDVDAHTGEIVGTFSRIYYGDVQGYGLTLYNGMQPITVSDSDYPVLPLPPSQWHLDSWNAYGDEGQSWWLADPSLGDQGGYADSWYEALESDTFSIKGENPTLSFYHRYSVEPTVDLWPPYDGWDGMNVWISVDSSKSWQILLNPTPAYTCSNLYSFSAEQHGVADSIPGWAGQLNNWTQVTFDLSQYSYQTIQLRFAFASDPGLSTAYGLPECFGWQIDDILVVSSENILFANSGIPSNITPKNLYREVTVVEGRYRLRESGRCGIFTYNSQGVFGCFSTSIDFTDEDSLFTDQINQAGVSLHWALENTYDYYLQKHERKSYDDMDSRLLAYANQLFYYEPDDIFYPNNAMWRGNLSTYGAGDGTYYGPWVSLDIVGHEITHGVTQYSAELIYQNEPGALNESFSDIFGTMVEFFAEGGQGDWNMCEDVPRMSSIKPIRSLRDPKSLGNPDTYLGEYWVASTTSPHDSNDYGGVHTNGGVQNHWFYLLSEGGSGVNDNGDAYSVTGIGIEDAEQIAYRNLAVYLMPTSGYHDARLGSIYSAIDLLGKKSTQVQSVIDAWYAVGIYYPYVGAYAQDCSINGKYHVSGIDTLNVVAEIINPEKQDIEVNSIIESFDQSVIDSIPMFDDGMHQEGNAGDGIYGAIWPIPAGEFHYNIHISAFSIDSGYYNILCNAARFTTVGPIVIVNDTITSSDKEPNPGDYLKFRFNLQNQGSQATAANITAKIIPLDTCSSLGLPIVANYGDIAAGETVLGDKSQYIRFSDKCSDGYQTQFAMEICSDGYHFWSDTFQIDVVSTLEDETLSIVKEFKLYQNYPNPFNPRTIISYQVGATCVSPVQVDLSIYNILGQKVCTLVSEKQKAGRYQVEWDAAGFASGIYYYRLTIDKDPSAGSGQGFVQTRKLVLLK